jgi:hypothetical protein
MPIEIGQLVINARVVADNISEPPAAHGVSSVEDGEQLKIVEHCVAEVLRILEDRQER